jgi:hypothetical protein
VARLEKEFAAVHSERPDLRVVLASDGAPTQWEELRSLADRVIGDKPRTELLDFFHCASRLGTAAKAIWGHRYPPSPKAQSRRAKRQEKANKNTHHYPEQDGTGRNTTRQDPDPDPRKRGRTLSLSTETSAATQGGRSAYLTGKAAKQLGGGPSPRR